MLKWVKRKLLQSIHLSQKDVPEIFQSGSNGCYRNMYMWVKRMLQQYVKVRLEDVMA